MGWVGDGGVGGGVVGVDVFAHRRNIVDGHKTGL